MPVLKLTMEQLGAMTPQTSMSTASKEDLQGRFEFVRPYYFKDDQRVEVGKDDELPGGDALNSLQVQYKNTSNGRIFNIGLRRLLSIHKVDGNVAKGELDEELRKAANGDESKTKPLYQFLAEDSAEDATEVELPESLEFVAVINRKAKKEDGTEVDVYSPMAYENFHKELKKLKKSPANEGKSQSELLNLLFRQPGLTASLPVTSPRLPNSNHSPIKELLIK